MDRVDIPFVFEFADPDHYARALASTGPAFEAMETVGEEAFLRAAAISAARGFAPVFPFGRPSRSSATSPGSRHDRPRASRLSNVQIDERPRVPRRATTRLRSSPCSTPTSTPSAMS